jgi:ornithine cyclodeaminase/alanine dehydrogenase-like protein (mu-crystallin family)
MRLREDDVYRVIEDDEVRALIDRAEVMDLVAGAYRAAAQGQADVSQPSALLLRGRSGTDTQFKIKGAILDGREVAGIRIVADGARTMDGASAWLHLADATTGRPLALVAETWLHRLRTATSALLACRALWPGNGRTLALVGTGRIAEEVIRCCGQALPQVEIVLASRSTERARAAAERWQPLTELPLSAAPMREALARADAVVTLTDAAERLFRASDLRADALVCAMGGGYEIDSDALHKAAVFVVDEMDFVCAIGSAAHWIETGQVTRAELEQRLDATLGELLAGKRTVARGRPTLAIIQGMAICDLAIAKVALDRAGRSR